MPNVGKYCWGKVVIFKSYQRYGCEAPKLLGLVSLQSELQEVLGADEDAGPLDDDETASCDGSEEKGQENIEPPVQTALLTASVPVAQVGSGGILCAFDAPTYPCVTCM